MDALVRIAGLCLAASVAAAFLKRSAPEHGVLLAAAAAALGGALLLDAAQGLTGLGAELTELGGLAPEMFAPLLKVTAVSLVARIGGALCADAGQSALARLMDAAGALCALGCAAPLLRAVTELIRGWL